MEEHIVVAVDVAKAVSQLAVSEEPGRIKVHRRRPKADAPASKPSSLRGPAAWCLQNHQEIRKAENEELAPLGRPLQAPGLLRT
jgi:hypothetical protein